MENVSQALFFISIFCSIILSIYYFYRNKNSKIFIFILGVLSLSSLLYYYFFNNSNSIIARGNNSNEVYFIVILYSFMLLGMMSHYFYTVFTIPKSKRNKFDFGLFIAPIFVSPIVFIPLLAAFQNTDIDLANLTLPKFMVFFVSFENGFFWREIFENRQRKIRNG